MGVLIFRDTLPYLPKTGNNRHGPSCANMPVIPRNSTASPIPDDRRFTGLIEGNWIILAQTIKMNPTWGDGVGSWRSSLVKRESWTARTLSLHGP